MAIIHVCWNIEGRVCNAGLSPPLHHASQAWLLHSRRTELVATPKHNAVIDRQALPSLRPPRNGSLQGISEMSTGREGCPSSSHKRPSSFGLAPSLSACYHASCCPLSDSAVQRQTSNWALLPYFAQAGRDRVMHTLMPVTVHVHVRTLEGPCCTDGISTVPAIPGRTAAACCSCGLPSPQQLQHHLARQQCSLSA